MTGPAKPPFAVGDLVSIWGWVCTVTECRLLESATGPYWRVRSTWRGSNLDAQAADYTLIRRAVSGVDKPEITHE